jgi:hypothetical protein
MFDYSAIANHLKVSVEKIKSVKEWATVLFVVVTGKGARFVSKKIGKVKNSLVKAQEWVNSRSRLSRGGAGMGALFNGVSFERAAEKAAELIRESGEENEETISLLYHSINQGTKRSIQEFKSAIADEIAYFQELVREGEREAAMCLEVSEC